MAISSTRVSLIYMGIEADVILADTMIPAVCGTRIFPSTLVAVIFLSGQGVASPLNSEVAEALGHSRLGLVRVSSEKDWKWGGGRMA